MEPLAMIAEISIEEIKAGRIVKIPVFHWRYEDGGLHRNQLEILLTILLLEQPKEVLEVGTFFGQTTRGMAECLPGARIHTVDLPPRVTVPRDVPGLDAHLVERRVVGREFLGRPCAERIVLHLCDTNTWDFREAGKPTFFFIDAAHSYEYVRNDSEKCLALCEGEFVFLWHDYDASHPGVVRLIDEWDQLGRNVKRISGTSLAYWKGDVGIS